MSEKPRALTASELAQALAEGQRSAWRLELPLSALYARHIAQAYHLAAKALPRIAKHSPAGGLSAAMDPAERAQKQLETTRRTRSAARRASARTPGSGGWSMPDADELGVALRLRMDEEWEKKKAGQSPEAIRIEAMRRTTAVGLELMHVSFDVRNPLVEGVLAQLGAKITEIEDTTRRDIMRSLDESWQNGDSIPRAARKLRAVSEQVSLSRGRLIARTEILGAVNGGAHALGLMSAAIGRETGEPALLKVWLTAEDEKVRDTHVDAGAAYGNGSGIPMDEPFQVGDSRMQYPGDPDGSAEEVCNCRCALSYEEAGGQPPLTADANLEDAMSELPSIIPDDAQPIEPAGDGRAWTSVLCLEGVPTSDGRMLGIDSVGWRELPLTLLAQLSLEDAHAGAIVAGRIDRIEKMPAEDAVRAGLLCERDGGYPPDAVAVVGYGVFDDSALGDEVQRLVGDEVLRGISVDLAPERGEVLELPPVDGQELGSLMEIMTAGSLMGATVCAHPAFAEASIRIDGADAEQPVVAAMRARTHLHVLTDAAIVLAPLEPARFAAQDHSAGSMIALHPAPAEADAIAQPGGQPAGDLHCTLAILPDTGAVDFAALHKIVAGVAAEHDPISGKVGGAGYFAPSEPMSAAAPPEVPDAETPADGEDAEPPADAADPPAGAEPHPHVALIDAPGMSKMRANLCAAMDDAGIPYAQNHDFTPHMTLGYEAAPSKPALHVAGQPVSFGAISVHEGPARTDHPMGAPAMTASAAGMAPEQPPSEWFENPELDGPTPITITDEGRIYGHLATWGTCHVGRPGECVEPPESLTDYALFHLGHVLTSDNELVPVGTLTLDTGHAGLTLGTTATQAHYDDTGTAAADVRCGEDDHGIWFAGAIRPDLDSRSVRALRAAKISGDWRPHNGTREMVAALAVNVPGFPVVRPRTAVAASGQLLGLVAAGVDLAPAAVPTRTRILELAERANPGTLAMRREALALRARNAVIEQR